MELPTLEVKPGGPLAGHTFTMRYPSTKFLLGIRSGSLEGGLPFLEAVLDHVVEHDLGDETEAADMPPAYVLVLGDAWYAAVQEQALPPVTGASSG